MAVIRLPENIWRTAHQHLFGGAGERVVFFLARWTFSQGEPVFQVRQAILVPDSNLEANRYSVDLGLPAILDVINTAVKSGDCLIEAHTHGGWLPRFSYTDRDGLPDFCQYVHASLPGRPYAATVWGDSTVYGEWFLPDGRQGVIDRITVIGSRLRQVVSRDDDLLSPGRTFDRQAPWFTAEGQVQLGRLQIAVVGCGGTGSHIIQSLAYLGSGDLVLIDGDIADETNLNRLVTATRADIGTPKVTLGSRLVKALAPSASVHALNCQLQSQPTIDALKGVDVIFGCVDNDGARLILNDMAVAYGIPLFDIAVGIEAQEGTVTSAGGRLAVAWPGGPCLHCLGQIDAAEAAFFLASPGQRAEQAARGYVVGLDVPEPAVVSVNAAASAAAINEFIIALSGVRAVNAYSELDLLGVGRSVRSQWLSPGRASRQPSCVICAAENSGDEVCIERYILSAGQQTR